MAICGNCKAECFGSDVNYWTADGSKKRKLPFCRECHERSVFGFQRMDSRSVDRDINAPFQPKLSHNQIDNIQRAAEDI